MSLGYAICATFHETPTVFHAAEKIRDKGFKRWDVLTPFPVHGLNQAMGLPRSKVGALSLVGGFIGFTTGMLMAWYLGAVDYPLIVGGKPFFSPIFPFPIAYELTILLAAFGAFFGQFIFNRLPMPYHPVMNYDKFPAVTDDKFIVVIECRDPLYDKAATAEFLKELGGTDITIVAE